MLEDAVVVDGTGAPAASGREVVVSDGRIVHVGGKGTFSTDRPVSRISLANRWLIPGLIDCHVHLVGSRVGREPFGRYLERDGDVRILRVAAHAAAFLAAGVTTIRHLGHGDPRHVRELRRAIASHVVVGPDVLSCEWAVSQSGGHGDLDAWPFPLVESVRPSAAFCDGEPALRAFVRQQAESGAAWIKVFATQGVLTTPERFADLPNFSSGELTALVDEAHSLGLRVAAHATGIEGAGRAVGAGIDTLEHGPVDIHPAFIEAALASGMALVPTLSVIGWAAEKGIHHGLPEWAVARARRRFEQRQRAARLLWDAGVALALGSDSGTPPRVFGTGEEVRALAAAGFEPVEILRMATLNGARALGLNAEIGSIEAGKRADIVALTADPLLDSAVLGDPRHVDLVVHGGALLRTGAPG